MEALLDFLARPELADSAVKPILVSDCKMITPEAVLACHYHHLYYLGPVADSEASRSVIESVSAETLARHRLKYRPKRVKPGDPTFQPYQGVWRPYTVAHGGVSVTDRALVVWSAGKQRLDVKKRKSHLKRLLDDLANIQKRLNVRRYKRRTYVEERLKTVQQRSHWAKGLVDVELTGGDEAMTRVYNSLCKWDDSNRVGENQKASQKEQSREQAKEGQEATVVRTHAIGGSDTARTGHGREHG
jgi:hypothetical protein